MEERNRGDCDHGSLYFHQNVEVARGHLETAAFLGELAVWPLTSCLVHVNVHLLEANCSLLGQVLDSAPCSHPRDHSQSQYSSDCESGSALALSQESEELKACALTKVSNRKSEYRL